MAHTKGPWHVGDGNGEGSVFADEGRRMRVNRSFSVRMEVLRWEM